MCRKQINNIKIVIPENGIASCLLANELAKNEITVSRWCTNDAQPLLVTLSRIAKVLDIEISELLQKTKPQASCLYPLT